jgi:hypothetical protein
MPGRRVRRPAVRGLHQALHAAELGNRVVELRLLARYIGLRSAHRRRHGLGVVLGFVQRFARVL